jgi:hypothetical protein
LAESIQAQICITNYYKEEMNIERRFLHLRQLDEVISVFSVYSDKTEGSALGNKRLSKREGVKRNYEF